MAVPILKNPWNWGSFVSLLLALALAFAYMFVPEPPKDDAKATKKYKMDRILFIVFGVFSLVMCVFLMYKGVRREEKDSRSEALALARLPFVPGGQVRW